MEIGSDIIMVLELKAPFRICLKKTERTRLNYNSNCNEEQQQQVRKSVWDCDSSLYDSFELYTFSRQLNQAIAAAYTPSSLINNYELMGGIRSWSMPHYVSTKSSTEYQYSPFHVEMNPVKEKLRSRVIEGNTHQFTISDLDQTVAPNEFELRLDARQTQKTRKKRMGFPRSLQRLFPRLFHKKA